MLQMSYLINRNMMGFKSRNLSALKYQTIRDTLNLTNVTKYLVEESFK